MYPLGHHFYTEFKNVFNKNLDFYITIEILYMRCFNALF